MLDEAAHSCLRDTPPTKQLYGMPSIAISCAHRVASAVHLQESDLAHKFHHLLLVRLMKKKDIHYCKDDIRCSSEKSTASHTEL